MINRRKCKIKPLIYDLEYRTKEAIQFIQKHEPPEGYLGGFSGGKDSCVTKDLVKKSGVKCQWYYSATGIDAPELVKFIRQNHSDVIFKRPKESFLSLSQKMDIQQYSQDGAVIILKNILRRIFP